jgi:pimeloyl-ACP methyl ester carboxylesterase
VKIKKLKEITQMPNIILVHGGKNTGEIWDKVAPLLQQHKNKVFCPTLSDPYKGTLQDHITEVCQLIRDNELVNVILVGHSYAGMVITGVADNMPEKLSHLIYVDAAVPESGQSLFDILNATGHDAQKDYGIEPLKPFTDPLTFNSETIKKIPKAYILCTKSEFGQVSKPMFDKFKKAPKNENWATYKINSSHHVMVEHPKELVEILLQIIKR